MLGRVYEYFLAQFASAEGKNGGEFYTPQSVVRVLVEMLEPYKGRVYRPLLRLGRHVRAEREVRRGARRAHRRHRVYGQEINPTTWRLAKMNLAIRGIDANLGAEHADSFHRDLHPDLKADFILANPPFNDQRLGRRAAARRRALEVRRPAGRQRQLRLGAALRPPPGAERRRRVRAGQRLDVVQHRPARARSARRWSRPTWWTAWSRCRASCSTATQIPVCLWFLARNKRNGHATATGAAKRCSSTRASWGNWSTGPTAN